MEGDFRNECRELLVKLKSTVEVLLGNHTTNVWNTYGGLSRLTTVVCNILKHRLKHDQGINADCWNFIMGLRVLIPTVAPWLERHRLATEGSSDRSYLWIQQLLQEHTLSTYLKVLIDDHNHLKACYLVGAFLRMGPYGESLLTCLKAVENNNLELLARLEPTLLVDHGIVSARPMGFTRSPSLPDRVSSITQHYRPKEVSPFVATCYLQNEGRVPHQVPVSYDGHLHRTCPVDPSKGSYYREQCNNPRVEKRPDKDFIRQLPGMPSYRPFPKSCTWDSALAWEHTVNTSEQKIPPFASDTVVNIGRSLSCDWSHLAPEKTTLLSHDTANKRLTKSMPSVREETCLVAPSNSIQKCHIRPVSPKETTPSTSISGKTASAASLENSSQKDDCISTEITLGTLRPSLTGASSCQEINEIENTVSPRHKFTKNVHKSVAHTPHLHRSPTHTRSKSDIGITRNVTDTIYEGEVNGYRVPCSIPMSSSLPTILPDDAEPSRPLDDEYPTPIFKRPLEGQSLTSFLSSQDFRTCAELDKENAHFSISEALIAAIEQIKCNQMLKIAEEQDEESDDEEIKHLKQRIRIRRRERLQEKVVYQNPQQLLSDGCTDTTTSQSPSPRSTSSENKSDGNTSDSIDPIDLSDGSEIDSQLSTLHESGLSLSMASLYSDADIQRPVSAAQSTSQEISDKSRGTSLAENNVSYVSAESVALSLIRKFSEKQLPKASDLEWLVSEQDAPQKLLPLPMSWPVSPDDAENVRQHLQMRLRGNLEWAPPRQQIIFNIHPTPQRKVIMAKQNYRCAGCGTKVEQGFMKRFRYCEYLGKYFCQCCHNNCLAYIPGRILRKWDFNKYYVSNFSRDLLQKMCTDPLYDISDVNPALYRRVKALHQVHLCRLQLYHIKDFIRACRNCQSLAEELEKQPNHLFNHPHLYSLVDLVQVKNGEMFNRLKPMVSQTLAHVAHCELCQARGFFCEFCKNDQEVIFPFQLVKVTQCPACWSCYHTECYVPDKCPKCCRIESRKQHLLQTEEDSN